MQLKVRCRDCFTPLFSHCGIYSCIYPEGFIHKMRRKFAYMGVYTQMY
jgi:hypothetical protein